MKKLQKRPAGDERKQLTPRENVTFGRNYEILLPTEMTGSSEESEVQGSRQNPKKISAPDDEMTTSEQFSLESERFSSKIPATTDGAHFRTR